MATERMNQRWYRVRDRVRQVWSGAEFSDLELKQTRGNLTKMVNLIHEKTGEPRPEISRKVSALI